MWYLEVIARYFYLFISLLSLKQTPAELARIPAGDTNDRERGRVLGWRNTAASPPTRNPSDPYNWDV